MHTSHYINKSIRLPIVESVNELITILTDIDFTNNVTLNFILVEDDHDHVAKVMKTYLPRTGTDDYTVVIDHHIYLLAKTKADMIARITTYYNI